MNKGKKITGGKYHALRKKKKYERVRASRLVKLGDIKKKKLKIRSRGYDTVLLSCDIANIVINKKCKKAKIKNVLETPSNRFLARQNIITKGSIIETDLGKVKVTNRPSQEGSIQGKLLVEEKK
jgi:small subunit ribosomal protein S8e